MVINREAHAAVVGTASYDLASMLKGKTDLRNGVLPLKDSAGGEIGQVLAFIIVLLLAPCSPP